MDNRYKEVLMTYVRRPFSSWRAVGWVAFMVWLAGTNGYAIYRSVGSEFAFGAVAIFSLNLWRHLYDQMEDPRRRLVPEFFRVTTTVFSTVGLAMVAVPPILLLPRYGFCERVFFAFAVFEFGLIGCTIAARDLPIKLICIAALLVPAMFLIRSDYFPNRGTGFATVFLTAISSASLLAVGLAACRWATVQMFRGPDGETHDGGLFGESANLETAGRSAGRFVGSLLGPSWSVGQMHAPIPEAKICYGPPMVLEGTIREFLRRWRHMRMLEASVLPALFLLCFAVSIIFGGFAHSASGITQDFSAVVPFAAFWPAAVVAGRWQQAWPCIRAESLRPESRAAFALGVFTSIAAQVLLAWLIFAVATLAASAIAGLGLSGMEPLASGLLATLLIQPLAYTALCWLLPYGTSAWMFFMVPLVFAMLGLGATTIFGGVSLAIGLAAICMLLGLILIPFVYRRWMNLEMG